MVGEYALVTVGGFHPFRIIIRYKSIDISRLPDISCLNVLLQLNDPVRIDDQSILLYHDIKNTIRKA